MCRCVGGNYVASCISNSSFSFVSTMGVRGNILKCDIFSFEVFFEEQGGFVVEALIGDSGIMGFEKFDSIGEGVNV